MRASASAPAAAFGGKMLALLLGWMLALCWPGEARAYAVLAHEAIIDAAWETHIQPLLLKRFPGATPEDLKRAHGYAYGGAIIQDVGYYPHGSHFMSDLTHYLRSGDFVIALLQDAEGVEEYAFALGALSHYAADTDGHRIGTNRAVPLLYPRLAKKYGQFVTYEEDKLAHVKAEFSFDVLEVAKGRYAPEAYHNFIGFYVAERLVEQAFCETYGLELNQVIDDQDKAFESYRHAVSKLIPKATRIAWVLKKDDIQHDQPGITKRRFLYNLSRSGYEKSWGKNYQQPSAGERFLAFLWQLVPKIGPLKVLTFKTPTAPTERMFEQSFNAALDHYRALLEREGTGKLALPDTNFDVGKETPAGQYAMNDEVHAKLLHELAKRNFAGASAEVRAELINFYADPSAPYSNKRNHKEWVQVQAEITRLRTATPVSVAGEADSFGRHPQKSGGDLSPDSEPHEGKPPTASPGDPQWY